MKAGSVIVDLAASTGGNVEGTQADQDVVIGGVTIVGFANFPGKVAKDASQVYASNVANLLEHLWDKDAAHSPSTLKTPLPKALYSPLKVPSATNGCARLSKVNLCHLINLLY